MFSRCLLNAYSLPGTVLTNTVGRKAEVLLPSEMPIQLERHVK